jgi:hypothetical protein
VRSTSVEHDEHGVPSVGFSSCDRPRESRLALGESAVTEDYRVIELDVEALLVELGRSEIVGKHARRDRERSLERRH